MYPTLTDLLKDLFGIDVPLPIQTFGFFMALAFLLGAWTLLLEFKRKEKSGALLPHNIKVIKGKPATSTELLLNGVLGFALGFKLIGLILQYQTFVNNPQHYILSGEGSFIGGLIFGGFLAYSKYRTKQKEKLKEPVEVEQTVYPHDLVGNMIFLAAVFGIIGAKIFHNLENIEEFKYDPVYALISFSGLTFYGGLIFATIAIIIYAGKNKVDILHLIDSFAPGLILAYGIGRIGCQLAGDGDWGIVNTLAKPHWLGFLPDWMWAFNYPHNVIDEGIKISGCFSKHCYMLDQPVFPTPFYEAVLGVLMFFILWSIRKRFLTPGVMFSVYLILNGAERFFIEKIRINPPYNIFGKGITQAEIISFLLILTGIFGIIYFRKGKRHKA
ncbi:MAG: prolipoprotein diacylglyceryl transferase [Bacteroidales bacterium]|nr:prolipoprotein diacylglyceryl transferase [Bacteroidales bacterium]